MNKILIIGAAGQVGTELILALRASHGQEQVIASDIREDDGTVRGPYLRLDATDRNAVRSTIVSQGVSEVYLMAAMLSSTAEEHPQRAWQLNMESLLIVLDAAKEGLIKRIFWPSSIAVFGPDSQKENCPQQGVLEPSTVYGISKSAGEDWCSYYHRTFGVDVRSVRYPGLIGTRSLPGGGTTDYAVHIFYEALAKGSYTSYIGSKSRLPMMHMDDAIRATLEIMEADADTLKVRTSYNISGMSFDPDSLVQAIQVQIPEFQISYALDSRDEIAASWPSSIDDSQARHDWGWKPTFDLPALVHSMLNHIKVPDSL